MRDLFDMIEAWAAQGMRAAIATVIDASGSSPRPVGSVMAVREDGLVFGSVSGGCVETAVIEEARKILGGCPPKILEFSAADPEKSFEIGLSCGGKIRVLVEAAPDIRESLAESRERSEELDGAEAMLWFLAAEKTRKREPYVWITLLDDVQARHMMLDASVQMFGSLSKLTAEAVKEGVRAIEERRSFETHVAGKTAFIHWRPTPDRLIIIGAVHIAIPLISFAKQLGFETIVIDPRGAFAASERFDVVPDKVITEWPQEAIPRLVPDADTYAVTLTHDPKIDDAALRILLRGPARYVGALGSKSTQATRGEALRAEGFSDEEIAHIHGPIGLDIGARAPAEIALAIMAEIVAVRRGKSA